jgi:PiT family inorganic phosphate transporter
MEIVFLVFAVFFLAYSNGANDNMKGVATLLGSNTVSYRKAISIATIFTFLGSIAAMFLAGELLKNFGGKGLVPDATAAMPGFILAVGLGASSTVFLATKLGFPISTTHSLTGALVGGGLMAPEGTVSLQILWSKFFMPLIASPLIAVVATILIYLIFKKLKKLFSVTSEFKDDVESYSGKVLGLPAEKTLNFLHYFSACAVSFARGLNDTPKVAALLVTASVMDISHEVILILIGVAIALGGIISAKKVAETMSFKITKMNHGQGFSANLVTALLVIFASKHGVPVSTTHVSCGSLFGLGLVTKKANWKTIGGILASWVITLPLAATLTALSCMVLK